MMRQVLDSGFADYYIRLHEYIERVIIYISNGSSTTPLLFLKPVRIGQLCICVTFRKQWHDCNLMVTYWLDCEYITHALLGSGSKHLSSFMKGRHQKEVSYIFLITLGKQEFGNCESKYGRQVRAEILYDVKHVRQDMGKSTKSWSL